VSLITDRLHYAAVLTPAMGRTKTTRVKFSSSPATVTAKCCKRVQRVAPVSHADLFGTLFGATTAKCHAELMVN